jgi:hypothetical protein
MRSAHFLITTGKSLHLPVTLDSVGGGHSHLLVTVRAAKPLQQMKCLCPQTSPYGYHQECVRTPEPPPAPFPALQLPGSAAELSVRQIPTHRIIPPASALNYDTSVQFCPIYLPADTLIRRRKRGHSAS